MAAFKMEIDGEELTFPSEEHAVRFFLAKRRMATSEAVSKKAAAEKPKVNDAWAMTYRFLEAIKAGGDKGADSEHVVEILGVSDGRGVGSKLTGAKKILKSLGYPDHKAVFFRIRVPRVGRFWRAGPKFSEAFQAVEKKMLI